MTSKLTFPRQWEWIFLISFSVPVQTPCETRRWLPFIPGVLRKLQSNPGEDTLLCIPSLCADSSTNRFHKVCRTSHKSICLAPRHRSSLMGRRFGPYLQHTVLSWHDASWPLRGGQRWSSVSASLSADSGWWMEPCARQYNPLWNDCSAVQRLGPPAEAQRGLAFTLDWDKFGFYAEEQ